MPTSTLATACVAALVALGLLNPFAYGPSTAGYPQLLGLLVACLLMLQAALSHAPLRASAAWRWLAALAGWVVLQSLVVQPSMTFVVVVVAALGVGLLLQWRPAGEGAEGLAWGLAFAAGINALIGWLQFFDLADALHPWLNVPVQPGVVFGNLRQPNQFASALCMGLAGVWWLCRTQKLTYRLAVAAVALLVSGVVISGSRTGVLELVLLGAAAWLWRGTVPRRVALLFVALPALYLLEWGLIRAVAQLASLVMTSGLERFGSTAGPSRLTLWQNVLVLIAHKPWLGYGVHELGYAHFMFDFSHSGYKGRHMELIDNAHNIVLQSWVELGVFGMLLTVVPFAVGTLRARPWAEALASRQASWLVLGVLVLHSMLEYPLYYAQFWLPFCLAMAVVFAPPQRAHVAPSIQGTGATRTAMTASGVLLVGFFIYAAWDYDRVSQAYGGPQRRAPESGVNPVLEAQKSYLFRPYARFALTTTAQIDAKNAMQWLYLLEQGLRFSAEPRTIEPLIEALQFTGDTEGAARYLARYRAAFPQDYAQFIATHPAGGASAMPAQ
ncbi:MAG: O-antigen ligase C-terminal domain-containing protein [Betaproteobacteria bacterium]|nr:O-antigen ligase C-terminal domain-containing protein [Betaproteobacteria bacterium]